jgi:hypothetical protein
MLTASSVEQTRPITNRPHNMSRSDLKPHIAYVQSPDQFMQLGRSKSKPIAIRHMSGSCLRVLRLCYG